MQRIKKSNKRKRAEIQRGAYKVLFEVDIPSNTWKNIPNISFLNWCAFTKIDLLEFFLTVQLFTYPRF